MKRPLVSLIIPTLNRDGFLVNTLKDVIDQDYINYEVIVVDQSKTIPKEVRDLITNHNFIKYYQVSFKGLPEARNFGWQIANGEIIIYTDDDIKTSNTFISNYVEAFNENTNCGIIGGRIWEANNTNDQTNKTGYFNPYKFKIIGGFSSNKNKIVDHIKGCNFAVKKEVFKAVGGFNENLNVGAALYEEMEFCLRVKNHNFKIGFAGTASLDHLVAKTGGCRVDQIDNYIYSLGHNRGLLTKKYLTKFQKLTSSLFYLKMLLAFVVHYKKLSVIIYGIKGYFHGLKSGKKKPKVINILGITYKLVN